MAPLVLIANNIIVSVSAIVLGEIATAAILTFMVAHFVVFGYLITFKPFLSLPVNIVLTINALFSGSIGIFTFAFIESSTLSMNLAFTITIIAFFLI